MDTSCVFSPSSNLWAKRWMYRQGSTYERGKEPLSVAIHSHTHTNGWGVDVQCISQPQIGSSKGVHIDLQ